MKKLVALLALVTITAAVVAVPVGAASDNDDEPSIWVTDDFTKQTYNLNLAGSLNFKFPTPNTAVSSIDVDHVNGTLWGANDRSNKIVNYTFEVVAGEYKAVVLAEIFLDGIGSIGSEGVAVTLSDGDDTLWVVDDPQAIDPEVPTVYNISRDGTLISSFATSVFDPQALSPQAIAYDPFDQTLWISDNQSEAVYNVTQSGTLISTFATNAGPFVTADNPSGVTNVQGISVESDGILWLTARDTGKIYRVTRSGDAVLASFESTSFDPTSSNPVGVAFDYADGVDLGVAGSFAVLGLPGSTIKFTSDVSGVVGDVGLAAGAKQDFKEGLLTGSFLVAPGSDNRNDHDVVISGGTVDSDLTASVDDALMAAAVAAVMQADQAFGDIKSTKTLFGGPGRNVIDANKIELDDGETLTLAGDPSSTFVINVATKLKLKGGSSIVLRGGVEADDVLFNITGDDDASVEEGSVALGTILAPHAKVKVKGEGSLLIGTVISGEAIALEDSGRVRHPSLALAPGDLGDARAATVLALPGTKIKLAEASSVVVGDIFLGPRSKQEFSAGLITGALLVDPAADNTRVSEAVIQGGTVVTPLSQASADAIDASSLAATLAADQTFGDIKSSATIVGGPGMNVIDVEVVELKDGATLTLSGASSSTFILNVREKYKLKESSSIVLDGGLLAQNVLFNVLGSSETVVEDASVGYGTILAPYSDKLKVTTSESVVFGHVIGGHEIIIEKGASVGG
ncbi:MAG: DUF3494 domain-containing protein [Acidimicrobiales bacterium]|nr:DUF3494 domain-containing protein [Acidimicrobiales bacterium]